MGVHDQFKWDIDVTQTGADPEHSISIEITDSSASGEGIIVYEVDNETPETACAKLAAQLRVILEAQVPQHPGNPG